MNAVIKDNVVIGPVCFDSELCWLEVCVHDSCNKIEAVSLCPRKPDEHGLQEIVETGDYIGFAGGRCYFTELACGCIDADESRDIAAAR